MTRKSYYSLAAGMLSLGVLAAAGTAQADDLTRQLDGKHQRCLERIAEDQELALEEAMIWRDQGGGRRARHCEAMALFALGHEDEAAYRLDALAEGPDGGSERMRMNFRSEAANFWLVAGDAGRAYESATAGLDYDETHADLRISRARAYSLSGRDDYADTDLTTVLRQHPGHAEALRYRADIRLKQGRLVAAKADIEASLRADDSSVETALVRGRINEAIRLSEMADAD
ncbi:MAG: hypothetical protein WBF53_15170 [Litorimonas sp.]